ncbi:helix-turn-helix domain-containing protein [Micromonospora sp. NPDC049891]|uniref:helix-turn-helix domain-containing protein n=1 Tax=Micromonospora sp. NPDC049891 TaxID=3155655 RepID=UPI0033EBF826
MRTPATGALNTPELRGEAVSTPDNRVVLTIEEAAQRLGIGRTTMYALIKAGQIRTVTIGRLRRVPTFCLDEYVRKLLTNATPLDRAA